MHKLLKDDDNELSGGDKRKCVVLWWTKTSVDRPVSQELLEAVMLQTPSI